MSISLQDQERLLYADVWASVPQYADVAPGERYVSVLQELCPPQLTSRRTACVFDAGCGSGKGAVALTTAGYEVVMGDLTDEGLVDAAQGIPFHAVCLWKNLMAQLPDEYNRSMRYFDAAYCTDVLEHVPPQFTMLAVHQLLQIVQQGVLITVSLTTDGFGAWVGRPLHQTVQGFTWWRDSLKEVGTVVEARDLLNTGLYWVTQ